MEIVNVKYEMIKFTIASFLMLLPPILIIYLFEEGFWMSISLFFYVACCGGYISFEDTLFPLLRQHNSVLENRASLICISLCICLQLLLILVALFPFAMMSGSFINWINVIFDLKFDTCYEGGIIVSILTLCMIVILIHNLVLFCSSLANHKKEIKKGIFAFVMFLVVFLSICSLRISNCSSEKYQFIQSQSEQEREQLDNDIMKYKMQKYKKYSDHLYE